MNKKEEGTVVLSDSLFQSSFSFAKRRQHALISKNAMPMTGGLNCSGFSSPYCSSALLCVCF